MMKWLENIEAAVTEYIRLPKGHKLRKYLDMRVVFVLCMFFLLYTAYLLYLTSGAVKFYEVFCGSAYAFCWNPVYDCSVEGAKQESSGPMSDYQFRQQEGTPYACQDNIPAYQCPDGVCFQLTLASGEHHGSTPAPVKNQGTVGVIALLVAVIANHLIYIKKTGGFHHAN